MSRFESARRSAILSPDGVYRYRLTRQWREADGYGRRAVFVMLNPSTADAENDDPTIRRCMDFANSWGCDGLMVVNLYAFRATDPKAMLKAPDPVGPDNDTWIQRSLSYARLYETPIVVAWGANAKLDRVAQFTRLTHGADWQCLGVTKDGQPRHPLYLRSEAELTPWPAS